jgi:hypothetical protein
VRRPRRYPTWDWNSGRDRATRLYLEVNTHQINRPYLMGGWIDERAVSVALAWGTRGSDPVCMIDLYVTLPEWLGRRVDRVYARSGR